MEDIRHAFTMKCVTPVRQSEDKHQHFGRQNCMELMEICFSTATSQRSKVRTCTHILCKQFFIVAFLACKMYHHLHKYHFSPLSGFKQPRLAINMAPFLFPYICQWKPRLECNLGLINYRLAAPGLTFARLLAIRTLFQCKMFIK